MMKSNRKLCILAVLCLILGVCLLVACNTSDSPSETTDTESDVTAEVTQPSETPSETTTDPSTEAPTEEGTDGATEAPTEELTGWEQDTGKFNDGIVDYTKQDGTVVATPTEGHTLGLDITHKQDLVSICYTVWFDAILGKQGGTVDSWNDVSEVLAGRQDWGSYASFHYWAKPAAGYYASSNTEVIRTHMTQLYTAGVDFIIVDLTNAHDGYLTNGAYTPYIKQPLDALFSTIMEMRAEGLGTPYVVLWVGDWVGESKGPLYQKLYDEYYNDTRYKDCFVYWDEKPLLLTVHTQPEDFPLKDKNLFTVRSMWNYLSINRPESQWSYMAESNYRQYAQAADGTIEQMNVATAAFPYYMSWTDTAHGRQGGLFWYAQWSSAFETRPKIVTLTWWNEWTAQRLKSPDGDWVFTDNYNQEFSRDIEPMAGGHGDQYYQWMIQYISAYKGHLPCPVLVEDSYHDKAEQFLEDFRHGSVHKVDFDLSAHDCCGGSLVIEQCLHCTDVMDIYSYDLGCSLNLEDTSDVQIRTDENGTVHYLLEKQCPDCGMLVKVDTWDEQREISYDKTHQIIQVYLNGELILETKE